MGSDFVIVERNAKSAALKMWGGVTATFNATSSHIWPARKSLRVLLSVDTLGDG